MKKCPYCAEEIQVEAIKCKHCGEMLGEGRSASSRPQPPSGGNPALGVLGFLVFVGGMGGLIYFWQFYDSSVSTPTLTLFGQSFGGDRINNIGLMQDRQNGMIVSGVFAALGFACAVISRRGAKNP